MRAMKVIAALALVAMLAAALGGCLYINLGDGKAVSGSGHIETKEVALEQALTGIRDMGSIDVIIDPSLDGKAVIEGDDNLLDYVELFQDSEGVLTVDYDDGLSVMFVRRMRVHVPAFGGGAIEAMGSGDISMAGGTLTGSSFDVRTGGSGDISLSLEADDVSLSVNGSGDMDIAVKAAALDVESRGSGDIGLSGTAQRMGVSISGSGDLEAAGLETQDADVNVSGSGDASVTVTGSLTGSVSGSGDLEYSGNPAGVDVSDNGSGSVRKR
jgi:hypothetical protein